jgi:hypothetical protein
MVDTPKMLKCNHCKRTVTEHAMPKHIERCLNKKQEKQRKKKEAKDARDAAARRKRMAREALSRVAPQVRSAKLPTRPKKESLQKRRRRRTRPKPRRQNQRHRLMWKDNAVLTFHRVDNVPGA